MRITGIAALPLLLAAATSEVVSQTPAPPATQGPKFDVVSIRRNTSGALGSNGSNQRPDGGLTLLNVPAGTLVGQAYGIAPIDMVGLPGWAMDMNERYDVSATSPLTRATPEERMAMMRALMADRFKLLAHVEKREQPVYDLVLARSDGRLGPSIKPSEVDCVARDAAARAAAEAALATGTVPPPPTPPPFDPNGPTPPCTRRRLGNGWNGDFTMATLAQLLRSDAGRLVIDKTGLAGSYRLSLAYERSTSSRGPDIEPSPDSGPTVFIAVQEQLGLKLESSKGARDALIIDRLERPTEN